MVNLAIGIMLNYNKGYADGNIIDIQLQISVYRTSS
jgi:hypothetical protein